MTYIEARKLLDSAPRSDVKMSRLNPGMTMTQAVEIIEAAINEGLAKGSPAEPVGYLMEKRVWQVVKNQRRPDY